MDIITISLPFNFHLLFDIIMFFFYIGVVSTSFGLGSSSSSSSSFPLLPAVPPVKKSIYPSLLPLAYPTASCNSPYPIPNANPVLAVLAAVMMGNRSGKKRC